MRVQDNIPRARTRSHTEAYCRAVFRSARSRATPSVADGVPVFVEEMRKASPSPSPVPSSGSKQGTLTTGQKIGRYVVNRKLGRGGMGVVYGGVDPALGRRVAIKLVRIGENGQPFRYTARLQREALALARLSHPNIVGIYDFGMTSEGTFVAMEFIPGCCLKKWLEQPHTVSEIVDVFVQAGRGVAAAHAAGIVHRDFKPSNVMVTPEGKAKVLDFGLARGTPSDDPWLEGAADDSLLSRKLTRSDVILGTTGYMPPEQLLGRPVGPLSDQFSFCVALHEALYGIRPFAGRNPIELARSYADGERQTPERPPKLPTHVRAVLERGLSLEPAKRYPNMDALLAALQRPRRVNWRLLAGFAILLCTACASAAATVWLTQSGASDSACADASDRDLPSATPAPR